MIMIDHAPSNGDGDWSTAAFLALNVYLDMLNVFLYVLRFLAASKSDD